MLSRINGSIYILPFLFLSPSSPAVAAEELPASHDGWVIERETPLEDILPCAADDDFKIFSLKAEDGKNIQLAIVCDKGKLTAYPIPPQAHLRVTR